MKLNNITKKLNQLNGRLSILVVFLTVLAIVSAVILCDRLGLFTGNTPSAVVSIGETSAQNVDETPSSSSVRINKTQEKPNTISAFAVKDAKTVWKTNTQVDIFKSSYENGEGEITVIGNGSKLLAPGTEYNYDFYVQNNGTTALDYDLTCSAFLSNEKYNIPVSVKFSDSDGVYLCGTETSWAPVLELNKVGFNRKLGANRYTKFTLEWQWPFESGNDEYDTLLGDLAVDEDLVLTISFNTVARTDTNPNIDEGEEIKTNPKTGDSFPVIVWTSVLSVSFIGTVAIVVFVVLKRRDEEEA